jgi:large subunit ribosomal protein L31e
MENKGEFSLECTINLHKRLNGLKFKKRTTFCINEIKKFTQKIMKTKNIRIDTNLNTNIWKNGPKHTPFRIRVRLSKKRFITEKNSEGWVVFVSQVKNQNFKQKTTEKFR